ncbi:hypothetical protein DOTSEDRAFT_24823 [Dothistroma septosporum NZE10]|uniref:Aflatoxin regulatory protein domain-containing protein n=1 Tax=Dothistroma septosporum (strain NZE10 / CBS 128990) TaxID=675120 RepID=M2Y391_DOTSN|nr:hypothetical protein DOTSEDRAFT_24823 [Dothistroma septosporum NZE10]
MPSTMRMRWMGCCISCIEAIIPSSPQPPEVAIATSDNHVSTEHRPTVINHTLEDALMAHVSVYALADYYGVPQLKHPALVKSGEECNALKAVSSEELLRVAVAVYESTSPESADLRARFLNSCFDHPQSSIDNEVFMIALQQRLELQEFSANLLTAVMTSLRNQLATLTEDVDGETKRHEANMAASTAAHAQEKKMPEK